MTAFVQLPDQSWSFAGDVPDDPQETVALVNTLSSLYRRVTICVQGPESSRSVPCLRLLGTDNPGQEL